MYDNHTIVTSRKDDECFSESSSPNSVSVPPTSADEPQLIVHITSFVDDTVSFSQPTAEWLLIPNVPSSHPPQLSRVLEAESPSLLLANRAIITLYEVELGKLISGCSHHIQLPCVKSFYIS
jgi:hypothetical protein